MVVSQLLRQLLHWSAASDRLGRLDELAAAPAWAALETELGISIRSSLKRSVDRLRAEAATLRAAITHPDADAGALRRQLVRFRRRYLQTETVVDFYADCVNTRTNPEIAARLQATDIIARRAMSDLLNQLGRPTPPVLTYLDRGLGASILKAGLRLWDGQTSNPAAVIKVVRHNLFRPTSLIHEAGHQVAHMTGWTQQLADVLGRHLFRRSRRQAALWSRWAPEMAADAFAFAHTGYASVAGLHDVLAGETSMVFRDHPADPHPIAYLRVLLGVAMCRNVYGDGPWSDLAASWCASYPLTDAPEGLRDVIEEALPVLPEVARLLLDAPLPAFGGCALAALIDPRRAAPEALRTLERQAGPAIYLSPHWLSAEPLRLLALTGLDIATRPEQADFYFARQDIWMRRLSGQAVAA